MYEKPIEEIKNAALGLKSKPQYRLYSAHDTQVANIVQQLAPSYNFTYVKYASNIYMMAYASPEAEVFVQIIYNGVPFTFEECNNDFVCTLAEFTQLMNERLFMEGDQHLKELCDAPVPTNNLINMIKEFPEKFLQYLI